MAIPFVSGDVRGYLHRPETPVRDAIALTHGAGSNCNAPLLAELCEALASAGVLALRYDLAFRQERPKGPPRPGDSARDRELIQRAAQALRELGAIRAFLGGHSYGGRQTTMAAATHPELAAGLLLLSYPLHPPDKPQQLRIAHFPDLRIPALFVHGTRDGFGAIAEMQAALALIPARASLEAIEGAGHDLKSRHTVGRIVTRYQSWAGEL